MMLLMMMMLVMLNQYLQAGHWDDEGRWKVRGCISSWQLCGYEEWRQDHVGRRRIVMSD